MKDSSFLGKSALLVITLWPLVYICVFVARWFYFVRQSTREFPLDFFAAHFVTMLLMFILLIFYSIDLYRNKQVSGNSKMLWTLGFILGNIFVMLLYWRKHIWEIHKSI